MLLFELSLLNEDQMQATFSGSHASGKNGQDAILFFER
jgi:hypothetical protein